MEGGPAPKPGMRPEEGPLWDFAVALYQRDGVSAACLRLQELAGLDVNMLLAAAWLGCRGVRMSAKDAASLDREVGNWRHEIVKPLRALRTRLKTGPAPAPAQITSALRAKIKDAELDAERIELLMIERSVGSREATAEDRSGVALENCEAIIAHFTVGRHRQEAGDALAAIDRALGAMAG